MDSIPILDVDYKAEEEEAAEVAGSIESSWYCSKHSPVCARRAMQSSHPLLLGWAASKPSLAAGVMC